jgi:hypothetical protein
VWVLDLGPFAAACGLELGAYRLLREALEGIADLWGPGERPVLVLQGLSAWPGAGTDPRAPAAVAGSVKMCLAGSAKAAAGAASPRCCGPSGHDLPRRSLLLRRGVVRPPGGYVERVTYHNDETGFP